MVIKSVPLPDIMVRSLRDYLKRLRGLLTQSEPVIPTHLFARPTTNDSSELHSPPEMVPAGQHRGVLGHPALTQRPGEYLVLLIFTVLLHVISQVAEGKQ